MAASKRVLGLSPNAYDQQNPEDEWEGNFPPSNHVIGPRGTGIAYLPGGRIVANLVAGTTGTKAFSIENPYPVPLFISSMWIQVTTAGTVETQSSSAKNAIMNIGIVASSSATGSDVGLGIGVETIHIVPVVVGGADQLWAAKGSSSDAWLVAHHQVGGSSLAGRVIIEAVPLFSS